MTWSVRRAIRPCDARTELPWSRINASKQSILTHAVTDPEQVALLIESSHQTLRDSRAVITESREIAKKTSDLVQAARKRLEEIDRTIEQIHSIWVK
jgi:hypothetical protein